MFGLIFKIIFLKYLYKSKIIKESLISDIILTLPF